MRRGIQRSTSLMLISNTVKKYVQQESAAVTRRASSKSTTVNQGQYAQLVVAKSWLME